MAYTTWSTLEVRRLRELWERADSVEEVAEAMGRTVASVREKARSLGLRRKEERDNARLHWTPQEDRALLAMWQRGVPIDKAARALGRSERAARRRISEIRHSTTCRR